MFSALPPNSDVARCGRYFAFVPLADNSGALEQTRLQRERILRRSPSAARVAAALVGAVVIHSLVYLSIDPGSLSAQMPVR
jgi:hypothetical protein